MFDSHAHLDRHFFGEAVDAVLDRAFDAGLTGVITIGSDADPEAMREAAALARRREAVWAAVGVHPHEADRATESSFATLVALLDDPRVVAVGETGLDYHYDLSSQEGQREVFRRQVRIAAERGKPLVVHCREAHDDCIRILSEVPLRPRPGVIHCFTSDLATATRYLDLGYLLSIPGVVTFRNAADLVAAVAEVRAEQLLVETDAPFLAPSPCRGRPNEPAFVRHTIAAIARIKGLSFEDVARITEVNARRLFGLPLRETLAPRLTYRIRDSVYVNLTNRCTLRCTFCRKFKDFVVKGHNLRLPDDPGLDDLRAAIEASELGSAREVVFCGYGEPLLRLEVVRELAGFVKSRGIRVRVNTDGLASLVHGRDVPGELVGLVDCLSVSLNAADAATYARSCRSRYGEAAFPAVLAFLRRAAEVIPEVVATAVVLPGLDVEAVRRLAEDDLHVRFRARPLDDMG